MNKTRLIILLSILPFLVFITDVKANTFSQVTAGYGYTPVVNGTAGSRSWVSYNSNNLVNYGYNLSDTNYYNIDEFNIRFRPTGGFHRGTSYTVIFTWENFHPSIDTTNFYADWLLMTHSLYCYSSSWSSTGQTGSSCFNSSNISATNTGTTEIIVTLTFVPSSDFYGLALVNQHGSTFTFYKSMGWEVFDISYSYSTDGSQDIINNANQNTENIINNQNQNTQDIIDNQNENTQAIIDSNKSCTFYDLSNAPFTGNLNSSGNVITGSLKTTDFIKINPDIDELYALNSFNNGPYYCFYDNSKTNISCTQSQASDNKITIPTNARYFRFTIRPTTNRPRFKVCKPGSSAVTDTLTDSDVDGANNSASNFFSNFNTETYGLTSVITAPLSFIQSLTSKTCSPLVLPLPYVNKNMELPCMRGIYEQHFGGFLTLYQTITFGIISYWIVVRIFNLVKDFKNPDHDEIEVMDL